MTKARNISTGQTLTQGPVYPATSGSEVDYDIPNGTLRITVMWDEVSLTSASPFLVQLGTSGGIVTTGYTSRSRESGSSTSVSNGFVVRFTSISHEQIGMMTIVNITGNTWISNHVCYRAVSDIVYGAGRVALADTATTVRITKNLGGTFDNGQINVLFG